VEESTLHVLASRAPVDNGKGQWTMHGPGANKCSIPRRVMRFESESSNGRSG
jgi:hypothetical protein